LTQLYIKNISSIDEYFGLILKNLQSTKLPKSLKEFIEFTTDTYPDGHIFKNALSINSSFSDAPNAPNALRNRGNPRNPNVLRPLCVGSSTGRIVSDIPPSTDYVCFLCKNKFTLAHCAFNTFTFFQL
jgi:hypothetical protein